MQNHFITLLILAMMLFTACKEKDAQVAELGRANAPAQPGKMSPMNEPAASADTPSTGKVHRGIILETRDVTNYTYIHFRDSENLEHWAAVLKGNFKPGEDVIIEESIVMKNFTSPTINQTFESIIFGNVAGRAPKGDANSEPQMPAGHPPVTPEGAAGTGQLPEGHPPIDKQQ